MVHITGGMAYEALNNASGIKGNFVIILNDNTMSISKNVGGVSNMLSEIRSSDSYYDLKREYRQCIILSFLKGTRL